MYQWSYFTAEITRQKQASWKEKKIEKIVQFGGFGTCQDQIFAIKYPLVSYFALRLHH